jgi:phage shock protein PspC (stress-responsive transcriptional regulator)
MVVERRRPDDGSMPSEDTTTRPVRRLHRSRRDKVVAGVAGGLGEYLGIDPVIIRIGFVALAIAGGSGVLLYALGWLFLPEEGRGETPGAAAFHSLFHRRPIVAIVLCIIGLSMLFDDFGWDHDDRHDVGWPLALVAIGAVILFSQRRGRGGDDDLDAPPPPPAGPDLDEPRYPGDDLTEVEQMAEARAEAGAASGDWSSGYVPPPMATASAKANVRPRSFLTPVTISLLLIGGGVAALLGISLQAYLAGSLLLVGAVLLLGSRVGQARGLVVVGLVLAAAATLASVWDVSLSGGMGDRLRDPATPAELEREYRLGAGELTLDLSDIEFTDDRTVDARVGLGQLRVVVPDDVDLVVHAKVAGGEVNVLGEREDGLGVERTFTDDGDEGAPRLTLDLDVGFGEVEVDRAAA